MSQTIHSTEVDGIPTLFAYSAGPMRAGLVFRVGVADETLSRAGVTHLVEHLALHRQGLADYHFNGATKAAFTHFHVEGAEHEIVAYLDGVCTSLADLPMERLETEKEILRTEEARRDPGQLALWRYGAQGYGLPSYPEWGVRQLRPEDVHHWAGTWFTRDNAALWIAGERLPAGLRLKLPAGARRPMPAVTSALPERPAYFSEGTGGVLLDCVPADTTAARLYSGVLERELSRALRQEGGYSYTAATSYESRRDGFAVVTAFADALPAKQDAVLGGFVDVLAKLQAGRIEPADLEAVRTRADAALTAPDGAVRRLPGAAEDLLAHRPLRGTDELRSELWATTPGHLHAVALEAAGTALMQVPTGHRADWAGFAAAPTASLHAVAGKQFPSVRKDGSALVVGDEGVSLTTEKRTITVLYRECAAQLSWPDGGRQLVGSDGLAVQVEPGLYGIDAHTMATIDAAVHPAATVWLPPRQQPRADAGAAADGASPARSGRPAPARRTGAQTAGLVIFGVLAGLWSLVAAAYTIFGVSDPETTTGEWAALTVFLWIVAAGLALPAVRIQRRTRRTSGPGAGTS
ncbi:insulinase family protein [Streptomyces sp. NPDC002896]|uniref:insulinase family protein n=1 Tax=Streptomyces sp. NPDC002896 TaxID=3154438 RepID=UPI00331C8CFF